MKYLAAVLMGCVSCGHVVAEELHLPASTLYNRSVVCNLQLSPDGETIELEAGELFEDDGPAAGYSYKPNEERLSAKVWIKKLLWVPNPAARKAMLLVGPGGELSAIVNGKTVELGPAKKVGGYWQSYSLPPEVLKAGNNEIILFGTGRVWIARAEDFCLGSTERTRHPGRSARSADGGKSWNHDQLGPSGDISGEYYVRLYLERYRPAGSLLLPVLDGNNLANRPIAAPSEPVPLHLHLDADAAGAGKIRLRVRTGTTPVPDRATWSDWRDIQDGKVLRDPTGRYFQVALDVTTADGLRSPRIRGLRLSSYPLGKEDWSAKLKVLTFDNAEMVRTSVPFAYEPFDHPHLKELRVRYRLDEVVEGAKTELALIERLACWSAQRWQRGHLHESYPPWNALEILKPHADGTPVGGFCQQYNLVFLQACASFGIPGRAVSISVGDHGGGIRGSGHEVVELWSNQFRKWIYVDGNLAWYAADARSGVPLSLWELRHRQLSSLKNRAVEPTRFIHLLEGGKRWKGLENWPAFLELRLIPRSNFLEKKAPLPLNQGMRGWFWTGHYVWTDADYPASLLYGHRISHRGSWEWHLNQAHIVLEATATPGELRVHLDTETPGFDTFLADIDGAGPRPVSTGFLWKLQPGKNHLEVWTRNIAGRTGPASRVVIERP